MRLTQIPDASPAELFKKYQKVSKHSNDLYKE